MYGYRLVTVASGAASGKLLEYEVGGPRVSVQTAYGVEVEVRGWNFLHKIINIFSLLAILFLHNTLDSITVFGFSNWCSNHIN